MSAPTPPAGTPEKPALGRVIAIGCFAAWIGGFSGAMIAVLLSKAVAFLTKAPSCDGIPSCDWYLYAMVGGILGAISLPWLVVSALRSAPPVKPEDGAKAPDSKNPD